MPVILFLNSLATSKTWNLNMEIYFVFKRDSLSLVSLYRCFVSSFVACLSHTHYYICAFLDGQHHVYN